MRNQWIISYLTARYEIQCEKYPLTRRDVTLEGYINANYQQALKNHYQHEELVARGQVQPIAEEI